MNSSFSLFVDTEINVYHTQSALISALNTSYLRALKSRFICILCSFIQIKKILVIYGMRIHQKKTRRSKVIRNERANNAISLSSNVFLPCHLFALLCYNVSCKIQVILIELLFRTSFTSAFFFCCFHGHNNNVTSLSFHYERVIV